MLFKKTMKLLISITTALISLAATSAEETRLTERSEGPADKNKLSIDSGQALHLLTTSITNNYKKSESNQELMITINKQGGGLKRLCDKRADISEGYHSVNDTDLSICKQNGVTVIALPIALDALVFVANHNNNITKISIKELRSMWAAESQSKINNWDKINNGFTSDPLNLYGSEANSSSADFLSFALYGKNGGLRTDITASSDDGLLAKTIERDFNGFGYINYPYYFEHKKQLKAMAVESEANGPIFPTPSSIKDGSYKYFSRTLHLYINQKSLANPKIREYVYYYLSNAPEMARKFNYIPFSESEYKSSLNRIKD